MRALCQGVISFNQQTEMKSNSLLGWELSLEVLYAANLKSSLGRQDFATVSNGPKGITLRLGMVLKQGTASSQP